LKNAQSIQQWTQWGEGRREIGAFAADPLLGRHGSASWLSLAPSFL